MEAHVERTFITGAAPDHRAFRPLAAMSKDITPLIHTISGAATKHSARLLLAEMTTKDTAFRGKPSAAATNHLALLVLAETIAKIPLAWTSLPSTSKA